MLMKGFDAKGKEVGRALKGKRNWTVSVWNVRITVANQTQAKSALGVYGAVSFRRESTDEEFTRRTVGEYIFQGSE
jgi:hypothetical protein